jgi:hypothetical protein
VNLLPQPLESGITGMHHHIWLRNLSFLMVWVIV